MKHIKKRFLLQAEPNEITLDEKNFEIVDITPELPNSILSAKKNQLVHVQTETGHVYGGFVHQIEGKNLVIPIPDPTLIYFNNAQQSIRQIKELRKQLIGKIDYTKSYTEPALNEIYHYFGVTSGFIIFLFTSIESFINQQIPDEYVFKKVLAKKSELFDKKQILEYMDFNTKLKEVLKEVTGKDFFKKSTPANQIIFNLKAFRDDIVHTKSNQSPLQYDYLIKESLNFKYEKALSAVADFMNHYKPEYIVECDCGADF